MQTRRPKFPPYVVKAVAVLVVLSVPLFLISASVAWAVNDPGLYRRGFEKYNISVYSGITSDDLNRVGYDLRRYFNSSEEPLNVVVSVYGQERELYNEREVHHMRDVKGLVRGVYWVAAVTLLLMVVVKGAGYYFCRWNFTWPMARWGLYGGLLTLGIVAVVGLFALVGFDSLFLLFHQVSFTNDLWQLDPRTDYLLIMFPQGFWFDATIRVALTTILGAVALSAISGGYIFYMNLRNRPPQAADLKDAGSWGDDS
ncbi:MAG: TIGR01906 family membrane protein [Chloroflexi bacterium]|nr:TIGR01906 family membrane protein [Chloroflexota bacterium]